ncbi:30579_t:CDS:2 [Gigaspora margarita]|uniref:30579_t:CDS:1 n=1 Tax=Gigaspora margarita TaxID=4874 RepID=A0ABM8VY93_GIGMA|nr:30579_t:CDS:2 [Gigaspora margarita]
MANDECANDSRDNCSIPYHLFVLNESNLTGLGFSSDSFKIYRGNQNLMDSLVCVDHCADLVFEYATIIRDECLCGNSAFDNYYNQLFNDSSCNFNCTSYSCGGMTAYRIYRTTREYHYLWNKDKNKSEKYNLIQQGPVNCVLDAPDTKRLMTCKAENKTTMNVEHCMDICKTNGYGCAGLEDGSQCFCGNTSICTKGPFSNDPFPCSSSCPNNPSQTCGGPWALSVYPIESQPLPLYAKILIATPTTATSTTATPTTATPTTATPTTVI